MSEHNESECECAICSGKMDENQFILKIIRDIRDYGCSTIGVGGNPPWTYSVGMTIMNHPDIVVAGIHPDAGNEIINGICDRVKEGERFSAGSIAEKVIKKYPVVFKAVDPANYDEFFGIGRDVTDLIVSNFPERKDTGILQMVWPDKDGKFQWEEGFDETYRQQQFWEETN